MELSYTEENYLKAIYHLSENGSVEVSTNGIADVVNTRAASVSDMLKKLAAKKMIYHRPYFGVSLTEVGNSAALGVIRKHRLWEVFLVNKLQFNWDEVHEVAEQLEHIKSPLLIQRLDEFLGFPSIDPHGDPIPNEKGQFISKPKKPLSDLLVSENGIVVLVKDTSPVFLKYMDKLGVHIGSKIKVIDKVEYDGSVEIRIDNSKTAIVSKEVSENIMITD